MTKTYSIRYGGKLDFTLTHKEWEALDYYCGGWKRFDHDKDENHNPVPPPELMSLAQNGLVEIEMYSKSFWDSEASQWQIELPNREKYHPYVCRCKSTMRGTAVNMRFKQKYGEKENS